MRIYTCLPALAAVAALATPSWGAAGTSAPVITLRVVNEGGADLRALRAAQKEAVGILEHSGIRLMWLFCEPGWLEWGSSNPCNRDRGRSEFWLRLVARKPAAGSRELLGFTEIDESQGSAAAGIYYPAAVEVARHWSVPVGAVLGAAIAHEVGHLVLGENAHSRSGVMCAHWGLEQFVLIGISELHFTPDQSRAIRERMTNAGSAMPQILQDVGMVEGYLILAAVMAGTEEVHGSTRPARRAGTQIVGATKGVARAKQEFVALSLRFR